VFCFFCFVTLDYLYYSLKKVGRKGKGRKQKGEGGPEGGGGEGDNAHTPSTVFRVLSKKKYGKVSKNTGFDYPFENSSKSGRCVTADNVKV